MPSKSKTLTKAELAAYEAKRDLAAELLQAVREMKAGKFARVTQVAVNEVVEARQSTGMSQAEFASALLNINLLIVVAWVSVNDLSHKAIATNLGAVKF